MRFNLSMALVAVTQERDETGAFRPVESRREVFGNRRNVGATSYMAARSAGLHADAEVQLRSCDYAGEQTCELDGTAYEVERAKDTGDFTVLTLKRRLSNG